MKDKVKRDIEVTQRVQALQAEKDVADVLKVYGKTIERDKVKRDLEVTPRAQALEAELTASRAQVYDMKEHVVPAMNEHVVADIEDLQFMRGLAERAWAEPSAPKTLSSTTRSVTPTRRSRPSKEVYAKQTTVSRADREELSGGMVPGMQTVFMKTQGCAHNVSDGEYMAGLLASYGYEITEEWSEKVDVFLFNSCTVKGELPRKA